jgi:hypothetical protein
MDAVAPADDAIAMLRAISEAGFRYERTKKLAELAGWRLVDDEEDLGYVAFEMRLVPGKDLCRRLFVQIGQSGQPPRAFVPLFCFEDYDSHRRPFDEAFRSLSEQLTNLLCLPSSLGHYSYAHREGWLYSYTSWSLIDATFVLVQDEMDIQFGMDITLWLLPAGEAVELPVRCE